MRTIDGRALGTLGFEPGAAGEFTERSHPAHIFDRIAVIF